MTITSHGPICDVGGEYILMPALGIGEMHTFSASMIPQKLHCCDEHKQVLIDASTKNDWTVLPEGPLRKAYTEVACPSCTKVATGGALCDTCAKLASDTCPKCGAAMSDAEREDGEVCGKCAAE